MKERWDDLIYEMPYCAACGRTQTERHRRWQGKIESLVLWPLHPSLVGVKDRRAVIPVCQFHREMSLEEMLWLKMWRDGAFYDRVYLSRRIRKRLPDESEPRHLREEFRRRLQEISPSPGDSIFVLEEHGADSRALNALELYFHVKTTGDLQEMDILAIRQLPPLLGTVAMQRIADALREFSEKRARRVKSTERIPCQA